MRPLTKVLCMGVEGVVLETYELKVPVGRICFQVGRYMRPKRRTFVT